MVGRSKDKFEEVYTILKSHLLHSESAFDFDDVSRRWVDLMLDDNVPGGKLYRGISVVDSYKLFKGSEAITNDEFFLATVLGWCIEWFQASSLVLDDIMDDSYTRRGRPCWFRVPHIGMKAVNGGILLANHINRIIRHYFKAKPYYIHLMDLFNEVMFQTASGQMIDLITTFEGEKDLRKYNFDRQLELQKTGIFQSLSLASFESEVSSATTSLSSGQGYNRIVRYKTAYYSFYLPVAAALVMFGENLDKHSGIDKILIDMGIYYQAQDDFLDCYGDPTIIGKIGTDIEDFKCSWLVVKALELCSDEQRKLLIENYGKQDKKCVAKVKKLYRELNLKVAFESYESESYEKLCKAIVSHHNIRAQAVLTSFLAKIYMRHK